MTKMRLTVLGKDLLDGASVGLFDIVVEVGEMPADAAREQASDGGFAATHKANKIQPRCAFELEDHRKRHNGNMPALLPLFPLQLVVFPRIQVPLHIFEERYKELIADVTAHHSEFGIVRAKDAGISSTGCTVAIEKVLTRYPDGRMDILTRGARRFEVLALDQEKSYLRGEVEFFNDEDDEPVSRELKDDALSGYRALIDSGESQSYSDAELDDPQLSFQLAQSIQDMDFQALLLRDRSEVSRLRQLAEFLKSYVPRVKLTSRMKELAPKNGFGHHPAGF